MKVFEEMLCVKADKKGIFTEEYRYAMYPTGWDEYAVVGNLTDDDGIVNVKQYDDKYSANIENEDEAVFIEYLKSDKRKEENQEALQNLEREMNDILGDNVMGKMFGQLTKSMTKQTMKNMGASKEETQKALDELDRLGKVDD